MNFGQSDPNIVVFQLFQSFFEKGCGCCEIISEEKWQKEGKEEYSIVALLLCCCVYLKDYFSLRIPNSICSMNFHH